MAHMIPPYISDEVKSTGEKQIFNMFKNDPDTREWIVLHSLALAKHTKQIYGEIDFVVLAPKLGIFCLEVKSGRVSREDGVWKFTDRFGETKSAVRGPFQQAKEAMFSLIEAVWKQFGKESRLSRLLFGYGVMFPHIHFSVRDLEFEWWQIYDRDSRRHPVSSYIQQLSKYTRKKVEHLKWYNDTESLPDKSDISQLLFHFRRNFEIIVTLKQRLSDIEDRLNEYTAEQFKCLDQINDNARCLFQGAAGTGKTLIALETVRRSLAENKKILFVCFNSLLGNWLKSQFHTDNNLTVASFHKFLKSISNEPEHLEIIDDAEEYFRIDLPLMALEAINTGVIEPFDKLIIDEGQDLITEEYLDVFDALLKGGLSGGEWGIFCDFEKQAIYSESSASEMLGMLEKRSSFIRFRLTMNCRNTKPVGEEVSLVCGFEKPPFLWTDIEGLPVEYFFYNDQEEEKLNLEKILLHLRNQKIKPGSITILSPFVFKRSVASHIDKSSFQISNLSVSHQDVIKGSQVTFSTIQGFKGLENSYIILADITRLTDDYYRSLLYVGMSRAKVGLYILLSSSLKNNYNQLIKKGLMT
ncbi:MAG: ATP-binding domain-containing protein [Desulfobacterales bacterium]|nr:ATP-binding domain-containing protein [Desulfobacterales bacterium]